MPTIKLVEILEPTRTAWRALSPNKRQSILTNGWITRIEGEKLIVTSGIEFDDESYSFPGAGDLKNASSFRQMDKDIQDHLRRLVRQESICIRYQTEQDPDETKFASACSDFRQFKTIKFGSPVAEYDKDLAQYFVLTKSFEKARDGQTAILIGPKGSGKSAILRELVVQHEAEHCIVITPEVFATSQLSQFKSPNNSAAEEEQAFTSTWIFTIFIEVFKKVIARPQGISARELTKIRELLRTYSSFADADLFSRFIDYLKRIEQIKVGQWEISLKTRELQKLYSLEDIYSVVPALRTGLKRNILILIDELDNGWDNSTHSNRFVAGLLLAATKVQSMGLPVRVIVLIRHEMFDLVKGELDQLDKLRSSIDQISWSQGTLASLVVKRAAYSLGLKLNSVNNRATQSLFGQSIRGVTGFDYIVSRTTSRPREVLQFVGKAHEISVEAGINTISADAILAAESEFSQWKLEHLASEYRSIYPKLADLLSVFRGMGPFVSRVELGNLISAARNALLDYSEPPTWIKRANGEIIQILYSIDFVGIEKPGGATSSGDLADSFEFSYQRPNRNARMATEFLIHRVFWKALEVPGG